MVCDFRVQKFFWEEERGNSHWWCQYPEMMNEMIFTIEWVNDDPSLAEFWAVADPQLFSCSKWQVEYYFPIIYAFF